MNENLAKLEKMVTDMDNLVRGDTEQERHLARMYDLIQEIKNEIS